jgi:hypothetical protein
LKERTGPTGYKEGGEEMMEGKGVRKEGRGKSCVMNDCWRMDVLVNMRNWLNYVINKNFSSIICRRHCDLLVSVARTNELPTKCP